MSDPTSLPFRNTLCLGPCFYRGTFNLSRPGDTFLDTSQLSKGQLWVNGHALGRFWKIGPQKTLYVPGVWLKQGANEVIIFDMDAHPFAELQGLTQPNLGP
jgi:beta-galactosidase